MVTRLHPYWQEQCDVSQNSASRQVAEALIPWIAKAEALVKQRPGLAIGAAVALGMALGCLVKRR
jgi:ElaB/YqjD/DUF883 family membrane-anchored ribosome-binding protein